MNRWKKWLIGGAVAAVAATGVVIALNNNTATQTSTASIMTSGSNSTKAKLDSQVYLNKTAGAKIDSVHAAALAQELTGIAKVDFSAVVVQPPPPPPSNGKRFKYTHHASITMANQHDITISGDSIDQAGGLFLNACYNVHITKNYITNPGAVCIHLSNCYNITIDSNFASLGQRIVYAENCPNGGIVVINNQFMNPKGPVPAGQFVQFDNVKGAGNRIDNNRGENIFGVGKPEDCINLYESNGTAASPISVQGNLLRGGGPSSTGGGIMTGDYGGGYQYVANNIVVNPGQYGIAIAGGNNISLVNNQVYGAKNTFTNVGLYVWNNDIQGVTIVNPTVSGNAIYWINSAGDANPDWNGSGLTIAGWSTNKWQVTTLDPSKMLPKVLMTWQ